MYVGYTRSMAFQKAERAWENYVAAALADDTEDAEFWHWMFLMWHQFAAYAPST